MARGNDPQDRYAFQAIAGFACVAFFDIILIIIGLLLLAFVTGFAAGTDTTLTLLHGVHIALIIVALIISFNGFTIFGQLFTLFFCILGMIGSADNLKPDYSVFGYQPGIQTYNLPENFTRQTIYDV